MKQRRRPYHNLHKWVMGETEIAYLLPLIRAWLSKRERHG